MSGLKLRARNGGFKTFYGQYVIRTVYVDVILEIFKRHNGRRHV